MLEKQTRRTKNIKNNTTIDLHEEKKQWRQLDCRQSACIRSSLSSAEDLIWCVSRNNLITNALWPNHNRYQYDISLIVQAVSCLRGGGAGRENWPVSAADRSHDWTEVESSSDATPRVLGQCARCRRDGHLLPRGCVYVCLLKFPQLSWLAFDHRFVRTHSAAALLLALRFQQLSTKRRDYYLATTGKN